jgi:hypothetical protein
MKTHVRSVPLTTIEAVDTSTVEVEAGEDVVLVEMEEVVVAEDVDKEEGAMTDRMTITPTKEEQPINTILAMTF